MPTIHAGELGDPTRVIEVAPLVSPLPTELPPSFEPELDPEPDREEVEASSWR